VIKELDYVYQKTEEEKEHVTQFEEERDKIKDHQEVVLDMYDRSLNKYGP
jgi:hypothetical protein